MARTTIILTLTLLATLTTHGQDSQDLDTRTWGFGAYFMPSIVANHESSGEIAFSPVTGLKIEKQLSDRLTLGTGLTYYTTDMFNGSWWGAPCATPMSICHWYSKRTYLEVPLNTTIYYSKTKNSINPYLTLGALTTFSIKTVDKRIDELGNDYTTDIYEDSDLRYQQNYISAAFGTEFQIADHLDLFVEPTFRYSFNSLIGWIDFNHTIMVGLTTGLTIRK